MKTNWWRRVEDMDVNQKAFIDLPSSGKYSLIGPPGSGKTNLLLLRAQYLAGSVDRNILVITYTSTLAKFIRSGNITDYIDASQIMTYHSWAFHHMRENGIEPPIARGEEFTEDSRDAFLQGVQNANVKIKSRSHYSAIFIDEAQDLSEAEIRALTNLSENICVCGDANQGIFKQNGLEIIQSMGLRPHVLKTHYRIGQAIAKVADRIIQNQDPGTSLEATSNYNPKIMGTSSAKIHHPSNRKSQFDLMLSIIRIELVAFNDDLIGVLCPTNDVVDEVEDFFSRTDIADLICCHRKNKDASFSGSHRIHILTIHSAKGVEFRAVHLFAAEGLGKFPRNHRQLSYTAVTRAKTALNAYASPKTNNPLEAAFYEPKPMTKDSLFPDSKS